MQYMSLQTTANGAIDWAATAELEQITEESTEQHSISIFGNSNVRNYNNMVGSYTSRDTRCIEMHKKVEMGSSMLSSSGCGQINKYVNISFKKGSLTSRNSIVPVGKDIIDHNLPKAWCNSNAQSQIMQHDSDE